RRVGRRADPRGHRSLLPRGFDTESPCPGADPVRSRHARARACRPQGRARGDPGPARLIVLDTTVLVYAKGADHPLRQPSRSLLEAVAAGTVEATTTPEVIQEFVHVRARWRPRRDAAELGRSLVELLSPLLTIEARSLLA